MKQLLIELRYMLLVGLVLGFILALVCDRPTGAQAAQKPLNLAQACLSGGLECPGMSLYVPNVIGVSAEDEILEVLQPTYLGVQVTLNGQFLQGGK